MKRLILFSAPTPEMQEKVKHFLFPTEFERKVFAYLTPAGMDQVTIKYMDYWKNYAAANNAEFVFIDSTKRGIEAKSEAEKIMNANILMITGGNTFELKHNLMESGLDKTIQDFVKKDNFVLAGFSAGAIIMTPNINVASQPAGTDPDDLFDENLVGVTDFSGLSLINYEVYPHYDKKVDTANLENYRKQTSNEVKPISDDEFILVEF